MNRIKVGFLGCGNIGCGVYKLLETGKTPDALGKEELEMIVTCACTAAGLSTTRAGGISSVPDYSEVINR